MCQQKTPNLAKYVHLSIKRAVAFPSCHPNCKECVNYIFSRHGSFLLFSQYRCDFRANIVNLMSFDVLFCSRKISQHRRNDNWKNILQIGKQQSKEWGVEAKTKIWLTKVFFVSGLKYGCSKMWTFVAIKSCRFDWTLPARFVLILRIKIWKIVCTKHFA